MPAINFTPLFRCLLLGWLLGSFALNSHAQQLILNGTVSDGKTALPIEGVSVKISPGSKVSITNSQGRFVLKTDSLAIGAKLTFSHLSYEALTLNLQPGKTDYAVKLSPKSNPISEVKITASKKLKPEKLRPETIVDYAVRGNQVFVLAWEKDQEKPSLLVLEGQTDTLQLHYRLPFYTESLFVDCLDNLHLLTAEKSYLLHMNTTKISFNLPHTRQEFDQFIRPCLAADSAKIYFRKNVNNGVIVSFFSVDRKTDQATRLQTVADEIVLTMQSSERRFQFFRAEAGMNRGSGSAAVKIAFAQKVMFEPPYVPLIKMGKQLLLFDHVNSKLEVYKNDSLLQKLPINYHLQKNFAKEIIIDERQQKAYTLFRKDGLYELKRLNLETGETENSYRIANPFAEKISVQNGQVYFLYRDPNKQNRQFLYKATLSTL